MWPIRLFEKANEKDASLVILILGINGPVPDVRA
jgi:hypothetical protein